MNMAVSPVYEAQQAEGFSNVRQDFLLYDTIRIGANVPTNVPGWYQSFTQLADSPVPISFFDQRQEAETGTAYTNMKKKTGLDWPCIFTSFGVGFFYPDPLNTDMFDGDRAAAKLFNTEVPGHTAGGIFVGGADDKILSFQPMMAPLGFGPVANQAGSLSGFSTVANLGEALAGNQFQWANWPLKLPKDISLSTKLAFAPAAKDLLKALDDVKPIVFASGEYANEARIVVCWRGLREVQQVGDWHR